MIAALFVLAAREYAALSHALGDEATAARPWRRGRRDGGGGRGAGLGRRVVPARLRSRRGSDRQPRQRRGPDLSRAAGALRDGGHRRRGRAARARAAERRGAARRRPSAFGCSIRRTSRYHRELGEISTYLPGYKENGSVFCHTNPWVIIAEALRGRADRAMQYLRAIAPTYQADPDTRRTEPYVYAQMVAGPAAATPGEAKNSWLTGTASWSHVAVDAVHPRPSRDVRGPRRRSLHSRGLAVLQRAPRVPRRHLRDRSPQSEPRHPWRAQPHRGRQEHRRQRDAARGTGIDGPGEGRARLTLAALDDDRLELADGRWRLVVAPSQGGSLLACEHDGIAILKPTAQPPAPGRPPMTLLPFPDDPVLEPRREQPVQFRRIVGRARRERRRLAARAARPRLAGGVAGDRTQAQRMHARVLSRGHAATGRGPTKAGRRSPSRATSFASRSPSRTLRRVKCPAASAFIRSCRGRRTRASTFEAAQVWDGGAGAFPTMRVAVPALARFPRRAARGRPAGHRSLLRRLAAPRDRERRRRRATLRARRQRGGALPHRLHSGGRRLFLRRARHARGERDEPAGCRGERAVGARAAARRARSR